MSQAVHARSEDEAVAAATGVGYPVVLGLADESALLGAEGAVVRLHAADAEGVRRAWRTLALVAQEHLGAGAHPEAFRGVTVRSLLRRAGHELAVRSRSDPGIGPVLEVAGTVSGGNPGCRAFVLPPLSPDLIRELIEQTAPFAALRREGTDWPPLEQFFRRFSRLVVEQRWLAEVFLDLVVSPERVTVLEARVLLHGPGVREDQLPAPVLFEEGRGPESPPGARR
jgi:acetyltransferase